MRTFEVKEPMGKYSRLTVTPTRVTVKVHLNDEQYRDEFIEAAKKIAENVDYPLSLRSRMVHGENVTLKTKNIYTTKGVWFVYDFEGNLLDEGTKE